MRLLSYNVNCRNPDPEAALEAIAAVGADVALLQEISHRWDAALSARFAAEYPHRAVHLDPRAAGGLAVLSRLPIAFDALISATPDGWFPGERLVLDAEFGRVQILHVHLRPALDEHGWVTGYLTTPPIRLRQIAAYWAEMTADLPAIVAGDFNEEPTGTTIAFLAERGLVRAMAPGPKTWHYVRDGADVLALDIDHVMMGPELVASDGLVLDIGSSDHRPIAVTIDRA